MKQTSTKHTNKNTIRSGKTINSGNFDIDDYLSDLNEPDEPVSKTSSSKHDCTITPKSKTVIAPTSTGKSLRVLNKDGQRAIKAQRLIKAVAGKPSTTSKQQRKPVENNCSSGNPIVIGTDKIHLSVPVNTLQLERAIDDALQLVKLKEKPLTHRSIKGTWYRHIFVYTFGSHTPSKPCKAVWKMKSTNPKVKLEMEVDLNPNNLTVSDVKEFIHLWTDLFGVHARELAQQVGIMRIDNNADCPYRTDDLIIDLDGARMGEKYFVKTTAGAKLQSNYAGSAKSAERLSVYDKEGSEAHMEAQARQADHHQEEAHEDDALIHLKKVAGGERTRAEMRRVFEGHHPNVSELGTIADPFGRVSVYHIDSTKAKNLSVEFIAYLDCVRVRGVNGAGRYLLNRSGGAKDAKSKVQEFERQLARLAASWWPPQDFNASALDLVKSLPIWEFLRPRKVK